MLAGSSAAPELCMLDVGPIAGVGRYPMLERVTEGARPVLVRSS